MGPDIRPYPFDQLTAVSRREAGAVARLRSSLGEDPGRGYREWASGPDTARPLPGVPFVVLCTSPRSASRGAHQLAEGTGLAVMLALAGTGRALLFCDHRLTAGLMSVALGAPIDPPALPLSPGERGLCLYALGRLLRRLGPGCPWSIASLEVPDEGGLDEYFVLELGASLAGETGSAFVFVEQAALAQLAHMPCGARRLRHARIAAQSYEVGAVLARLSVPQAALSQLGHGDVVVCTQCPSRGDLGAARLSLPVGDGHVIARLAGDLAANAATLEIVEPYHRRNDIVEALDPEVNEQGTDETLVDSLPVVLTIELGRVRLTAKDVMELGPGDVLTLDRPVGAPVDLRVGGKLVARGELLDVDGETGVRVLETLD